MKHYTQAQLIKQLKKHFIVGDYKIVKEKSDQKGQPVIGIWSKSGGCYIDWLWSDFTYDELIQYAKDIPVENAHLASTDVKDETTYGRSVYKEYILLGELILKALYELPAEERNQKINTIIKGSFNI